MVNTMKKILEKKITKKSPPIFPEKLVSTPTKSPCSYLLNSPNRFGIPAWSSK